MCARTTYTSNYEIRNGSTVHSVCCTGVFFILNCSVEIKSHQKEKNPSKKKLVET